MQNQMSANSIFLKALSFNMALVQEGERLGAAQQNFKQQAAMNCI